jgi:sialate O-acetylesterase
VASAALNANGQSVDHVVVLSVDGLRPELLAPPLDREHPGVMRLLRGAHTLQARTDPDTTVTLPNHLDMVTGRLQRGDDGHSWIGNDDPPPPGKGGTLREMHGAYVPTMFDVAHDRGLATWVVATKSKFILLDQSADDREGPLDEVDADNGRDKIDRWICLKESAEVAQVEVSLLRQAALRGQRSLSLMHLGETDAAGHTGAWDLSDGSLYRSAAKRVDDALRFMMEAIDGDPVLRGRVAVILTADHGGGAPPLSHTVVTAPINFTIPFAVWLCGDGAPTDLYDLNAATRTRPDPAVNPPRDVRGRAAPIRNADAGNAALSLLGLPAVATSTVNPSQDLLLSGVSLPRVFGDHMVLQRDRPLWVWGTGRAHWPVAVELRDASGAIRASGQSTAGANGRFEVQLPAVPAERTPLRLRVECAGARVERSDVLVGDVWICGGQSNMEWPCAASDGAAEVAADLPSDVRCFTVQHKMDADECSDVESRWLVAGRETTPNFTAVGSWFALKITREVGVPVGLLSVNWGGSPAESWTPRAALAAEPLLHAAAATRSLADWGAYGSMWNGMMAPLAGYAIRGALWYQGESNADRADAYGVLLATMIRGWRSAWGQGAFPFGIVQLAGFRAESEDPVEGEWSLLRNAQLQVSRAVPACGLAVTIDVGDAADIHPRNKRAVGERLAAWALADVYGRGGVRGGPLLRATEVRGDEMVLSFDQAEGLAARGGGAPDGFAIAGADGAFRWADARIDGTQVIVRAAGISQPTRVRYGWSSNPVRANLVNGAGLPASPFASDVPAWPIGKPIEQSLRLD